MLYILLFASISLLVSVPAPGDARPGSAPAWELVNVGFNSPERPQRARSTNNPIEPDLFRCLNPTGGLFESFLKQYNRSLRAGDLEERRNLFSVTFKRAIMLNRIVQNEILNASNYEASSPKRSVGNYHFVPTVNDQNIALWYADINDCELGLIKHIVFDIFYLIDKNELDLAYKVAVDNSAYLPILSADGFEHIANILLVRLYDRFREDEKMNQLFSWPIYLKKLSAFAYNRRQMAQSDAKQKLPLIAFAYPAYFTDLKYNAPAIDRTNDNLNMHQDHEKFNKLLERKFASRDERNRRLATFRQRWTFVNLLNEDSSRWQNLSLPPDWVRVEPTGNSGGPISERLRIAGDVDLLEAEREPSSASDDGRFKHTQFSDLSDQEFVAYLTNDFSLLGRDQAAADYLDRNFPVRQLDDKFRNEIAIELELRRMSGLRAGGGSPTSRKGQRETVTFARRVLDELISEAGLPVGPLDLAGISKEESVSMFSRIAKTFSKSYLQTNLGAPSNTELADERQARLEQFALNYPKFRAWWLKEGWTQLNEAQAIAMLRLADMSWHEIKLSLFKLCCLTRPNLSALASANASLFYLASNDFLCRPLSEQDPARAAVDGSATATASELTALELYYYYSVHFNKHHLNMVDFERRFEIFMHNVEQIRRQSCMRSLTLFSSLELRVPGMLNTVDSLDARRSRTDDINLDRFKYFEVPNLNGEPLDGSRSSKLRMIQDRKESARYELNSRAGISYRRSPFGNLLARPDELPSLSKGSGPSYAERLASSMANDVGSHVQKYRELAVARIYDLVHQRYRYCMQTVRHIELPDEFEQQNLYCKSSGPLGDKATMNWNVENLLGRSPNLAQLQQEDQCAFYKLGLEPWSEGLISQQALSAQLIYEAKC